MVVSKGYKTRDCVKRRYGLEYVAFFFSNRVQSRSIAFNFVCRYSLARMFAGARTLRLADGPDEVHLETIARMEVRRAKL